MLELAKLMADSIVNKKDKSFIQSYFPDLEDEELTTSALLLAVQVNKARQGDNKSFELFRDTSGQKPIDKSEVNNLGNSITISFDDEEE